MARITVEDCVIQVPNRFELIHVAARRAVELNDGAPSLLPRENDKDTILALREIEEGAVDPIVLRESLIRRYQNIEDVDTPPEEETFVNFVAPSTPVVWDGDISEPHDATV